MLVGRRHLPFTISDSGAKELAYFHNCRGLVAFLAAKTAKNSKSAIVANQDIPPPILWPTQ